MLFVHTHALDRDLSPELVPMEVAALPTDGFFFASPPAQGAPLTLAAPGLGDFPGQDFAPAWHWEDSSDLDRAGAAWYLVGRHAQVFDALQRRGTGPVAFTSFGFNSAATPVFVLPSFLVGCDEEGAWITVAYQAASPDEPRADRLYRAAIAWIKNFPHRQRQDALQTRPAAVVGKTSYQENVAAAVRAIREGKAEKIVMARPARFEFAGETGAARARAAGGALAARLHECYPT